VSIVLPTFGRLKYLRPAIDSVYRQTLQDWELVVADDGSDEETKAYLRGLTADPRVRVIWLAHCGIPAIVRNAALWEARGEYVAFLDSDDLWAERKLERQVDTLRAHADCRWTYTAFQQVDARGHPLPADAQGTWVPYEGDIFEQVVTGRASLRTPCVLATRQLLLQAGGFDEALPSAEDYDLWLRLALFSAVAVVDERLVYVRRHEESHTHDWESAFIGRDRSLRTRQSLVDPARASILREERVTNALKLAVTHAELGARGRTLRALRESLPYSWAYPRWWLNGARIVLRPYVPRRVLELYRERRRDA
jgi:glycosyltransferase involved in cell wall biosynthesis